MLWIIAVRGSMNMKQRGLLALWKFSKKARLLSTGQPLQVRASADMSLDLHSSWWPSEKKLCSWSYISLWDTGPRFRGGLDGLVTRFSSANEPAVYLVPHRSTPHPLSHSKQWNDDNGNAQWDFTKQLFVSRRLRPCLILSTLSGDDRLVPCCPPHIPHHLPHQRHQRLWWRQELETSFKPRTPSFSGSLRQWQRPTPSASMSMWNIHSI